MKKLLTAILLIVLTLPLFADGWGNKSVTRFYPVSDTTGHSRREGRCYWYSGNGYIANGTYLEKIGFADSVFVTLTADTVIANNYFSGNYGLFSSDGDSLKIQPYKSLYFIDVEVGDSQIMYLDSVGNAYFAGDVGIGTVSPDNQVHVHESTAATAVDLKISSAVTGEGASDGFIYGFSSGGEFHMYNYENTNMYFGTNGASADMTLTAAGDLGVGTVSPQAKVEASGEGSRIQVDVLNTTGGGFRVLATTPATDPYAYMLLQDVTGTPYYDIQAGDGGQYRVIALNALGGNVSVGGTTSAAKLGVNTSGSTVGLKVDGNKTTGNLAEFTNDNDGVAGGDSSAYFDDKAQLQLPSTGGVYLGGAFSFLRGDPTFVSPVLASAGGTYLILDTNGNESSAELTIGSNSATVSGMKKAITFIENGNFYHYADGDTMRYQPYKELYVLDIEVANERIFGLDSTGQMYVIGAEGDDAILNLWSDNGDSENFDRWRIRAAEADNFSIEGKIDGSWFKNVQLTNDEEMLLSKSLIVSSDGDSVKLQPYKELYVLDIEVNNNQVAYIDSAGNGYMKAFSVGTGTVGDYDGVISFLDDGGVETFAWDDGASTFELSSALTVKSTGTDTEPIIAYASDNSDKLFRVFENAQGAGQVEVFNQSNSVTIRFYGGNNGNSYYNTGGNFGFGDTTPDAEVDVEGDIITGETSNGDGNDVMNYTTSKIWCDSTLNADADLGAILPAGYVITAIAWKNTTANALTNFDIGFTAGGGEIVANVAVGANEEKGVVPLQTLADFDAADNIFIDADGDWSSSNLILWVKMEKLF